MTIYASSGDAGAQKQITAAYSPSGNFIHVQQQGNPALAVGDTARFGIVSTAEARNFYYEVVSRGRVVFTGSTTGDIAFAVTPAMAPQAKLLVYQILPSSEVAADAIPFDVQGRVPADGDRILQHRRSQAGRQGAGEGADRRARPRSAWSPWIARCSSWPRTG